MLAQRAPTVGAALDSLVRLFYLQDRGSVVYLSRRDAAEAAFGYAILDAETPGVGLIYDMVTAMLMTALRGLCGPTFSAVAVHIAHAAPTQCAPYRRVFAAPVVFDAPHSEVRFDAAWLQAANVGADVVAHLDARSAARAAATGSARSLAEATRGAVRALVMSGALSAESVAAALGLHERTLRRRLNVEGTSLMALVAEARFDVGRQLLHETRLPLGEIAEALGYAEASAFVRAFRGWAGCTPGQWRQRALAGLSPPTGP